MGSPGRSCPLHYFYQPEVFNCAPAASFETVYVVGGLYGNFEALDTILTMKQREEERGDRVGLVFNGDFNWFDIDPDIFVALNDCVLEHLAIQGNVEAELCEPSSDVGCGCTYPDSVADEVVDRSNQTFKQLFATARQFPETIARLSELPKYMTIAVGDRRIGILHGDPESLSGWKFDNAQLRRVADELASDSEREREIRDNDSRLTAERLRSYFRRAGVTAFASTHTCTAGALDLDVDGKLCTVVNNGSAGLPCFSGDLRGNISRISCKLTPPEESSYSLVLDDIRFDAVPVPFDRDRWQAQFLKDWPPGSPAYLSYYHRITNGPPFAIESATLGRFQLRTKAIAGRS